MMQGRHLYRIFMMTRSFDKQLYRFCAGVEKSAFEHGVLVPLWVDFLFAPHLLLVAPSGGGKTHLLTLVLGQLAQKRAALVLADFKGTDFIALDGCKNYYRHSAVAEALDLVFQELQERMKNPRMQYSPLFFAVDEWSGFLGLYPKKEQEHFKQQLASILMLGRGVSVFAILALQRADAAYISGRDNIGNSIGLGRLSAESIRMTFGDHKDSIQPQGRGRGYLGTDGRPLRELTGCATHPEPREDI